VHPLKGYAWTAPSKLKKILTLGARSGSSVVLKVPVLNTMNGYLLWHLMSSWKSTVHINSSFSYFSKFMKGCNMGSKLPKNWIKIKEPSLVTWKLWTSMFEILAFHNLPFWFWYHWFDFLLLLLFYMNQNDITWLASKLPFSLLLFHRSLSAQSSTVCQYARLIAFMYYGIRLSYFALSKVIIL